MEIIFYLTALFDPLDNEPSGLVDRVLQEPSDPLLGSSVITAFLSLSSMMLKLLCRMYGDIFVMFSLVSVDNALVE